MKNKLLLIIALALFFPGLCFAGSLTPNWETMTLLGGGPVDVTSGVTYVGTIDMSAHYICELHIVMAEDGNNPSGSAGVSVYGSSGASGIPIWAPVWNATTVTDHAPDDGSGITKFYPFENVYQISVGAVKDTAGDTWGVSVYYRRASGTYTD